MQPIRTTQYVKKAALAALAVMRKHHKECNSPVNKFCDECEYFENMHDSLNKEAKELEEVYQQEIKERAII